MTATSLNTLFNAYGDAGGHWTGAGGTTSVALPDGRVVWLFSETFLGTVNVDHSRPMYSPMVNNTMVVQEGTQLTTTLHGGTPTEPRALVAPTGQDGQFFWSADGIVEDGKLKVFYNRHRRNGTDTLDLELTGNALVTFHLPCLTLASVEDLPLGSVVAWGSALFTEGEYTYIYGTSSAPGRMKFAHVARAPVDTLDGAWQFWTGSTWSADSNAAARLLSGVGTAYSVQKVDTQYLLVTHENNLLFDSQIAVYTATSPTGPFSGPQYVYTAPEVQTGSKNVIYDVRLHPELARSGKLLLSYNVNSLEFGDQLADARLYRPRFVEVDWPLPAASGVPLAPSGLTVTAADDTAQLSWAPVTGATSYRVHQRDVTGGQTHFARHPAAATGISHNAGLLIPGHLYEFRIAAENSAGESAFSPTVSATPQSTRPVAEVIGYAGRPEAIAGSYIVSLRTGSVSVENLEQFARHLLSQYGCTPGRLFPLTLHGFSTDDMTETQAHNLASHPDVDAVEQNVEVTLDD